MNSVQQSGASIEEISKVPSAWAWSMISSLSDPIRGRSTGIATEASVARMLSSVWEATWPRLSPVTRAPARSRRAISSATRNISRRYRITRRAGGAETEISRW